MDTTLKQRILGVVVLVGLLGFCLTVLLRNTKTQPHIQKINTHPAFAQTMPKVESPNDVFTKPAATASTPIIPTATIPAITIKSNTETQNMTKTQNNTQKTASVETAAIPTPAILSTPTEAPVVQQNTASPQQQPEVNLTGGSANSSATLVTNTPSISSTQTTTSTTIPTTTPKTTSSATFATASTEKHPHKHHHHHAATVAHKEMSKSIVPAGDKKNLMVQVGTFSLRANAESLVAKLHSKGFSAVSEKMKTSKGEMTRVIVGKKGLDHAQAETLRRELGKSMSLNGIIVSHSKD